MNQQICKCGSHAINPNHHGREKGVDLELCDVCYWRNQATKREKALKKATVLISRLAAKSLADLNAQCEWLKHRGEK